jgi:hypothetical protein
MEKVHALQSAVLAVADVGYRLLVLPFVHVNEIWSVHFVMEEIEKPAQKPRKMAVKHQ